VSDDNRYKSLFQPQALAAYCTAPDLSPQELFLRYIVNVTAFCAVCDGVQAGKDISILD